MDEGKQIFGVFTREDEALPGWKKCGKQQRLDRKTTADQKALQKRKNENTERKSIILNIRRPAPYILSLFAAGIFFQKTGHASTGWIMAACAALGMTLAVYTYVSAGKRRSRKTAEAGRNRTRQERDSFLLFLLCLLVILGGMLRFDIASGQKSSFVEGSKVRVCGMVLSAEQKESEKIQMVVLAQGEKLLCQVDTGPGKRGVNEKDGGETEEKEDGGKRGAAVFVGKTVSFFCSPRLPAEASNPGVFDYRQHLKGEGILMTAAIEGPDLIFVPGDGWMRPAGWILGKLAQLRERFLVRMTETAGEQTAAVAAGMLFGDTSLLEEDLYDSFRKNGTAHIMAVSGLHVGVMYGCVRFLLRRIAKKRQRQISVAFLVFYTALCGFSVSVLRASVMLLFSVAAEGLLKRYDMISAASTAGFLFLMKNPYLLFHTGFVLSFAAVFSLGVIGTGLWKSFFSERSVFQEETKESAEEEQDAWSLEKKKAWGIEKAKFSFRKAAAPMAAVQLGMMPLTAYFFNFFSPAAWIANIPVLFFSGIIIPVSMLLLPMCLLPDPLDLFFRGGALAVGIWIKIMIVFNDVCGFGDAGHGYAPSPSLWGLCGYYAGLTLLFSEIKYVSPFLGKEKRIVALGLAILVFCAFMAAEQKRGLPSVVFVDVGQGDCIHIRTPEGRQYLVDGGGSTSGDFDVGEKVVLPYLLKNGISELDGVFVTHMDVDHFGGIASLCRTIPIKKIYVSCAYKEAEKELAQKFSIGREDLAFLKKGDVLDLGRQVKMEILHPREDFLKELNKTEEGEERGNEASLVMKLQYKNTGILLTGDIGEEAERWISNTLQKEQRQDLLKSDVVKVAHHGSRFSSTDSWIRSLEASAAVVQVGKNRFGHPHPSVIQRYEEYGAVVFRTDLDGALQIFIEEEKYRVQPVKVRDSPEDERGGNGSIV